MAVVTIKGVSFPFSGGKSFELAPLNIKAVKNLQAEYGKFNTWDKHAADLDFEFMTTVVLYSLKRNYPDMTVEDVDEMADIGILMKAFVAIMTVMGAGAADVAEGGKKPGKK